jgi:anaerobic magnesium-protoporphyrin IX monomethyl ester cyclase
MNKILFIRPFQPAPGHAISPPLGTMYLSSSVRNFPGLEDYQTKLIDLNLHRIGFERVKGEIADYHPDIIGLSVITAESQVMHDIARFIKALLPESLIIVGGPHGTLFYQDILKDTNIDYVVVGEGETSFPELLARLSSSRDITSVKGIACREN